MSVFAAESRRNNGDPAVAARHASVMERYLRGAEVHTVLHDGQEDTRLLAQHLARQLGESAMRQNDRSPGVRAVEARTTLGDPNSPVARNLTDSPVKGDTVVLSERDTLRTFVDAYEGGTRGAEDPGIIQNPTRLHMTPEAEAARDARLEARNAAQVAANEAREIQIAAEEAARRTVSTSFEQTTVITPDSVELSEPVLHPEIVLTEMADADTERAMA